MRLVVDASVALKWHVAEPDSELALSLLDGRHVLVAPDLIFAEVANALWRLGLLRKLDPKDARDMIAVLPRLLSDAVATSKLAQRAIEIANELDHPAYDCFYLALAEEKDATLVTADLRLLARLNRTPWQAKALSLAHSRAL